MGQAEVIDRVSNPREDLYRFTLASILISLFSGLFFASIREQSIFELIPGLDIVEQLLTESQSHQI